MIRILLFNVAVAAIVAGTSEESSHTSEDALGSAPTIKRPRGIETVARMDFLRRGQFPGFSIDVPPVIDAKNDEDLLDIYPGQRSPEVTGPDNEPYWTFWSDWTACSRTCGGGASSRVRKCVSRYSTKNPLSCDGESTEHKLCNKQDCPAGSPDFREVQCSRQNGKLFISRNFKWKPFSGKDGNSCKLSCMATNFHFYHTFGKAMDGTKCGEGRKGICIKGECMEIGCDGIVGSTLAEDVCGVCGGNNDTCFRYQNVVDRLPGPRRNSGYNKVATIPIGSTRVKVTDFNKNYLALLEVDGEEENYVVNGNWIVSWPGEFKAAGTIVTYGRQNDKETFDIAGPTKKELRVMALCLGHQQPLIQYEYWIPISKTEPDDGFAEFKMQKNTIVYVPDEEDYRDQIRAAGLDFDSVKPPTLPPTTTSTTTTTTTTTSTTTTTATALTTRPTVAAKSPFRRHPSICTTCQKTVNMKKRFCDSHFVIHVRVSSRRRLQRGRFIRYEVEALNKYKSNVRMARREYVWMPSTGGQRLRPYRHYLLMGRKVRVGVKNSVSSTSGKTRQYEARLLVEYTEYWYTWRKYQVKMARVARHISCKRYNKYQTAKYYRRKPSAG